MNINDIDISPLLKTVNDTVPKGTGVLIVLAGSNEDDKVCVRLASTTDVEATKFGLVLAAHALEMTPEEFEQTIGNIEEVTEINVEREIRKLSS